jgi:FkbM family methyltransferase
MINVYRSIFERNTMKIVNEGSKNSFAIIERDTHMSTWALKHNRLDFDVNQIPKYIEYFNDGDVLLNIGANIGCYAKAFVDKASKVICFEPHIEAYQCLEYNLGRYQNVTLYNHALSDSVYGFRVVDGHRNNVGASKIRQCDDDNQMQGYTKFLDQFYFERLDFILMDCEGSEHDIINGAINTIKTHKPIIVTEVNDGCLRQVGSSEKKLIELIESLGYKCRNIYSEKPMQGNQFDIICFPKETNYF